MSHLTVHIVSESVGGPAELAVRMAAAQFAPSSIVIRRSPFIKSREQIAHILNSVEERTLILHTFTIPSLREYIHEQARAMQIIIIDLVGILTERMEQGLKNHSQFKANEKNTLNPDYFRKMEAVEFAVRYDDGRDADGILKADIVLIGVSRTSKTPLSMVLAYRKYKVVNIPLIPEVQLPKELGLISAHKVIGLTIDSQFLLAIRKGRLSSLGLPSSALYASEQRIQEELNFAHKVMETLGCVVIDISHKAVEETADLISEYF